MPLHHAVLALLSAKPAHGYELKSSFEQAVGDQWGGLNIGTCTRYWTGCLGCPGRRAVSAGQHTTAERRGLAAEPAGHTMATDVAPWDPRRSGRTQGRGAWI